MTSRIEQRYLSHANCARLTFRTTAIHVALISFSLTFIRKSLRDRIAAGMIVDMERQLHLWPDTEPDRACEEAPQILVAETRNEIQHSLYTPLKRLEVVHVADVLTRPVMNSSNNAVEFFREYWKEQPGHDQERFVIACLNVRNRVESVFSITTGTLDASLIHPREVFRPAVAQGASSIILSHNHPSGDPTPSEQDHAVTKRLTECGQLLGIEVLDHIIHGDGTGMAISLRDSPSRN